MWINDICVLSSIQPMLLSAVSSERVSAVSSERVCGMYIFQCLNAAICLFVDYHCTNNDQMHDRTKTQQDSGRPPLSAVRETDWEEGNQCLL